MPLFDEFCNLVDVERHFGDQNHVGATGNAAVNGDPPGVATHHLYHDDTVVCFGSGMHAIDGASCYVHGRVKAEGEVSAGEIVVDGLGHANHFDAILKEFLCNGKRVVAPIAMRASHPCFFRLSMQRCSPSGRFAGFVREVRSIVPPRGKIPPTDSRSSGITLSSSRPRHPSRKPTNSSW